MRAGIRIDALHPVAVGVIPIGPTRAGKNGLRANGEAIGDHGVVGNLLLPGYPTEIH